MVRVAGADERWVSFSFASTFIFCFFLLMPHPDLPFNLPTPPPSRMVAILSCRYPMFFHRRIESMFMLGGGDCGDENDEDTFQRMYGPTMMPSSTIPTLGWSLRRPATILLSGRSCRRCGSTRTGWRDGLSIIMLWLEASIAACRRGKIGSLWGQVSPGWIRLLLQTPPWRLRRSSSPFSIRCQDRSFIVFLTPTLLSDIPKISNIQTTLNGQSINHQSAGD